MYEITLNGEVAPPAQLNQRDRSSRQARGLETRKGGAKYNGVLLELQVPVLTSYGLLCSNRFLAGKMREELERESRKAGWLRVQDGLHGGERRSACSSHGHTWQRRPGI